MYEKLVEVPRLYATLPDDGSGHPLLDVMRRVLSKRYGEALVRTSFALYRDGRDSVVRLPEGARGRRLGSGDLFVMCAAVSGPSVPKCERAVPRLVIMFRRDRDAFE